MPFSWLLRIMVVHQRVKSLQRVSFPSEMTSHDIRLKVPAKQSCSKIVRQRKREGTREGRWKKSPWRTGPLSRFSPALPPSPPSLPSLAISHGLFPTKSRLGIWFPCAKARHYGESPRRARIKDSFEVIEQCYFLPSSCFSIFIFYSKWDSEFRWLINEFNPFYSRHCTR